MDKFKRFITAGVTLALVLFVVAAVMSVATAPAQATDRTLERSRGEVVEDRWADHTKDAVGSGNADSTDRSGDRPSERPIVNNDIDSNFSWDAEAWISGNTLYVAVSASNPIWYSYVRYDGNRDAVKGPAKTLKHAISIAGMDIDEVMVTADVILQMMPDGKTPKLKKAVTKVIKIKKVVVKEVEKEVQKEIVTKVREEEVTPTTVTTVAPVTTTTMGVTTTTVRKVTVTTVVKKRVPRERLPITGTDYNWYLIGSVLGLTGAGIYLRSLRREN